MHANSHVPILTKRGVGWPSSILSTIPENNKPRDSGRVPHRRQRPGEGRIETRLIVEPTRFVRIRTRDAERSVEGGESRRCRHFHPMALLLAW